MNQRRFLLPKYLNSSLCPADFDPLPVILISLDGFRPGYMSFDKNPVLKHLIKNGASAPYIATSYPSKTFPNHYSILTVKGNLSIVDNLIRRLIVGLKDQNILNCVNLVFTSDHGMAASGGDKIIDLAVNLGDLRDKIYFSSGPAGAMSLKKSFLSLEPQLERSLTCKENNMQVYKKNEIPLRLHFNYNKNIGDYVILLEEGYTVQINDSSYIYGLHGYDSHAKSMNGLFFAYGPSFKPGARTEPFQNIEIYNLICHLLDISPAPNNGTLGRLYDILQSPPPYPVTQKETKYPTLRDAQPDRYSASACEGDVPYDEDTLRMVNLSEEEIGNISTKTLPWGTPQLNNSDMNIGLLYHSSHVTAYSRVLKLPLWTSFIMNALPSSKKLSISPLRSDIRIDKLDVQSCPELEKRFPESSSSYLMAPLFPAELDKMSKLSSLVTNALPFSNTSFSHWEQFLLATIPRRLKYSKSSFHVTVGPVFDQNSDGIADYNQRTMKADSQIPTDIFAMVTRCKTTVADLKDCPANDLDAMGFVLPQSITINNCRTAEEFALDYSVKIHDIEIITGLGFFSQLPNEQRLKLILRERQEIWPLVNQ